MVRIASQNILRMLRRFKQEDVTLHGFELRQDGQIRAEGYYAPFDKGQPHRMYSVSKTMTGLAIGLLAQDGKLSLDDQIVRYFPDKLHGEPDARLQRLTIRDMLRMATCFNRRSYREGVDQDWSDSFFTTVPTHEPGTVFFYDTSCSQVLAALVQRLSGSTVLDFLQQRVFTPIGACDEKRWLQDPAGVNQGGTGLIMSLRDLGKTAQLMMDGGRGILPEAYLRQATRCQMDTPFQQNPEERFGYGWQLWMTRHGWAMYGMGGQMAIACPEEKILLCTVGDTRLDPYGVQKLYDGFFEEIMEHLDEPEEAGAQQALEDYLASMTFPALPNAAGCTWYPMGKYRVEDSRLKGVTVKENAVHLQWANGAHVFCWDALGRVKVGTWQDTQVPCLTSAGFLRNNTLRVRCHLIGDAPCGVELLLAQSATGLTLRLRRSGDPLTEGYEGLWWGQSVKE